MTDAAPRKRTLVVAGLMARDGVVLITQRRADQSEIAFGPYLSDMRNPGLDVVGALKPDAAPPIDVTGFISTMPSNRQAARALLDYLKSPEVTPEYHAAKMFAASDK